MDRDGYISNGELYLVLKQMVGNNLKDQQLQQIVDKTIMEADKDGWVRACRGAARRRAAARLWSQPSPPGKRGRKGAYPGQR